MSKLFGVDFKKKKIEFFVEETNDKSVSETQLEDMTEVQRDRIKRVDVYLTHVFNELQEAGIRKDALTAVGNIFHLILHLLIRIS